MDYTQIIQQAEQQYGLKPGVLRKLVEVESGFNPNAKSKAGAIGLTQLLPSTAKELGVDPNDPVQNIYGGAKYLKQNLDKFGDYSQAIAAYNAGPNNKAVIDKNWALLPTETKKYTQKFLDFIVPTANADEGIDLKKSDVPVDNTAQIIWDDEKSDVVANNAPQIIWDDEKNQTEEKSLLDKALGNIESFSHGAADWGTAGFADELVGGGIAAVDTLLGNNKNLTWDQKYKLARDTVRDRSDAAWDQHPVAYGTGAVAGTVANPVNKLLVAPKLGKVGTGIATGAASGALYGAGAANEMKDIPKDALTGAALGGTVGGVAGRLGKGVVETKHEVMLPVTNTAAENAVTNMMRNVGGVLYAQNRAAVVEASKQNVKNAYQRLDDLASNVDVNIPPTRTAAAIRDVIDLDNTALNSLSKNRLTRSALEKIKDGSNLNAAEGATLYQELVKISGVDGKTGYALKQAQKALSQDIAESGNAELTNALNTASQSYARDKSLEKLSTVVSRYIKETDNGTFIEHAKLANGLKNWTLTKEGKKVLKYNPSLAEDIKNYRKFVEGNKDLKKLYTDTEAPSFLQEILGKTGPGIAANVVGGGVGHLVLGPAAWAAPLAVNTLATGVKRAVKPLLERQLKKGSPSHYLEQIRTLDPKTYQNIKEFFNALNKKELLAPKPLIPQATDKALIPQATDKVSIPAANSMDELYQILQNIK